MSIMSSNIVIKVTVTAKYMPSLLSPAVQRSSCSMEYICIYRVVSSLDLLCHRCSWSSLLCRSIWSTPCMTWNPVELSSKLVPMTLILWSMVYANPVEKEPLSLLAFVRWSSWYLLRTSWSSTLEQFRLRICQMKCATKVWKWWREGLYLVCKNSAKSPSRFCIEMYSWPKSVTFFWSTLVFFPCFDVAVR